mgnify:CR=1 FL=1
MIRINGKDIAADGQNLLSYLTDQAIARTASPSN